MNAPWQSLSTTESPPNKRGPWESHTLGLIHDARLARPRTWRVLPQPVHLSPFEGSAWPLYGFLVSCPFFGGVRCWLINKATCCACSGVKMMLSPHGLPVRMMFQHHRIFSRQQRRLSKPCFQIANQNSPSSSSQYDNSMASPWQAHLSMIEGRSDRAFFIGQRAS